MFLWGRLDSIQRSPIQIFPYSLQGNPFVEIALPTRIDYFAANSIEIVSCDCSENAAIFCSSKRYPSPPRSHFESILFSKG